MRTKDFINTTLPLLDEKHTVKDALKTMREFHVWNLSAFIDGKYGFFSYQSLKSMSKETFLSDISHLLTNISLAWDAHIWEGARFLSRYETDVIPIIDDHNTYKGSLIEKDIINHFLDFFPIENGGAILEVRTAYRDYSLNKIASIVEGNNTKITLLTVVPIKETSMVDITFSIDKTDATDIIQALERHNYEVSAWFMNDGKIDHILEERYDAIMNFMNV